MRGRDEMDGQPEGRECGMQSSQSMQPMGIEMGKPERAKTMSTSIALSLTISQASRAT